VDRAHLREAAQHLHEVARLEPFPGSGHELDECLPGVAALADDEMPEVPALLLLVVRLEPLLARPVAHRVPDRVAEVRRQPALLDLEHLIPAAGLVEAERRPVRVLRERVLELIAVVEDRLGREQRLKRGLGDPAQADERLPHLRLLRGDLGLVGEILEAAAAAGGIVRAGRVDPLRARADEVDRERLRVVPLDLRDARADGVPGQAAAHEDDEAVEPSDAVAAVRQRIDGELELLAFVDRSRHAASVSALRTRS
jgi:hypothetical protein